MGVGGEGQPTQEHQRTPSTRKTPLGVSAIDAAIKNIQNDLHGNNRRAGDDMTATAMIGGGCGGWDGREASHLAKSKLGGGVSKQSI